MFARRAVVRSGANLAAAPQKIGIRSAPSSRAFFLRGTASGSAAFQGGETTTPPAPSSSVGAIRGTIPKGGIGVAKGQYATVERAFTADEVASFGRLIGDANPLHLAAADRRSLDDDDHPLLLKKGNGPRTRGGDEKLSDSESGIVVPGMLVSSLFSCIFGTLIPGAVYLSQSLDFRNPVRVGETVIGKVTITGIRDLGRRNRESTGDEQRQHSSNRRHGLVVKCDTQIVRGESSQHPPPSSSGERDLHTEESVRGEATVWLVDGRTLQGSTEDT